VTASGVTQSFRVGVIGYGLAGAVFHAPLIAATPGLRLSAIVTSNEERRAQAARRYPQAEILSNPVQLFTKDAAVDIVVIASPNRTHVPLAIEALDAGRHVVVDKPLAASVEDGQRAIATARARARMLTVFQNRRWDGDFLTLRKLVEDGQLGRVLRFESHFDRWRPEVKPGWRMFDAPEEAGGLLYDLGAHLIDQALLLFGPVTQVYAELDRRRAGVTVDDDSFVSLTHASGVRSHLWMNALSAQLAPRFRVLGDHAAFTKYGLDPQEERLRDGADPAVAGWSAEAPDQWGRLGTDADNQPVQTQPGAYLEFYRLLAEALRTGGPAPVDPQDAVTTLKIIEAAQRSAQHGEIVEPDADLEP
jgi:predicted dehydrogenase